MHINTIRCAGAHALSFYNGVICISINCTNSWTCTKYCISTTTESPGVSKDTLIIIRVDGNEFDKENSLAKKSNLKTSSKSIASRMTRNCSSES